MKKLLSTCLLIAMAFTSHAQDGKPTKEETVKFINNALKLRIGTNYNSKQIITNYVFTLESVYFEKTNDLGTIMDNTFSNLAWETLTNIKEIPDDSFIFILTFDTPFKNTSKHTGHVDYYKDLYFHVPENKKDSLKKAFLRLSEIAKEENKDPFQD